MRLTSKLIVFGSCFLFLFSDGFFDLSGGKRTYSHHIYSDSRDISGYREIDFSSKVREVRIYAGIPDKEFYVFLQDSDGDGKVEKVGVKTGFFSRRRIIADRLQDYERERERFDSADKILDGELMEHFLNTFNKF